jgi:hypothetical protein
MFQGHLGPWKNFEEDAIAFYIYGLTKGAFRRSEQLRTDVHPSIAAENPHFATLEHITVASEINLDGRFKANVVSSVRSVLLSLWKGAHNQPAEMPTLHSCQQASKWGSETTT